MVELVILQPILALEAFVALCTLVDLVVVHDLMLLQTNHGGEDFVADRADLRRARSVLVFMIFESVLTFELLVAL